ncbi:hypothetical protein CRENBAI_010029 [Crenichthys baileyi]|uniref:Cadherin domain-containing protein n=1 Tax=Crenichthys baileyi TaxID=28760 RepID=A0AAV9S7H0_9TELE
MLPASLHSGVLHFATPDRMFPPTTVPADKQKADALDRWVQQEMEEAMRNLPTDLEVLPSPLLLEQMERKAVQRRSPPAPLAAHSGPAVKPSPSSRRKKRGRGFPASQPLSARLAAPPSMPSSLTPARCSEAAPDELEQHLRFYARQIKSFRTRLMYSSPELVERIRQMVRDYETEVWQFYCRPPSPTPSHMSGAADQSTSGLQSCSCCCWDPQPWVSTLYAEQPTSGLQSAAAEQPTSGPQPDTPQPDPKSAATSSTRRGGRRNRGALAQVTEGLGDTSASAHATEGLGDTSASAHATEGPGDASAPAHATEGLDDASAPAHATEGLGDTSASVLATESFVLVLASEPRDKGFEEEAPSNPVPEGFKEQFFLVLVSEPRAEGSPGAASVSEGSASEVPPGLRRWPPRSPRLYRSPGPRRRHWLVKVLNSGSWTRPELYACTGRPPGRPPELCAYSGRPPGRPPELCFCFWPSYRGPHRPPCSGPEWYQVRVELTVTDVNDNIPEWSMVPAPYLAVVSPDATGGSPVYKLSAQDGDEGLNGEVEYFLSDGGDGRFEVDRKSGQIRTTGLPLQRDREYLLTVVAADGLGSRSAPAIISVVAGARPPQFTNASFTIAIPENTPEGQP